MQYSWPGIAVIGIIIVVGLIASMVLSKEKATRYASLSAFIALALVAVLFVVFIITKGMLALLPLFIVLSVVVPIAAYFVGVALAKHAPKGSKMVVPRAAASSQPISGAPSGDPLIPQNAATQASAPEPPLMVQEEVVEQAAVAEVVEEVAVVEPSIQPEVQPSIQPEVQPTIQPIAQPVANQKPAVVDQVAGKTEKVTLVRESVAEEERAKDSLPEATQHLSHKAVSENPPVRKKHYNIPSIEDIPLAEVSEEVPEESVVQPGPRVEDQPDQRARPAREFEAQQVPLTEIRPEATPEPEVQFDPEVKLEPEVRVEPEVKSEPEARVEPEVKPEQNFETEAEVVIAPTFKPEANAEPTPQVTAVEKPDTELKPEPVLEEKPEPKAAPKEPEKEAAKPKKVLQTRLVQKPTQEKKPEKKKPAAEKKPHAELCFEKAQALSKKGQHAVAACLFEEVANQGSGSGTMRKEARYGAMISYAKAGDMEKARPFAQALKTSSRTLSPVEQAKIEAVLKG